MQMLLEGWKDGYCRYVFFFSQVFWVYWRKLKNLCLYSFSFFSQILIALRVEWSSLTPRFTSTERTKKGILNITFPRVGTKSTTSRVSHTLCPYATTGLIDILDMYFFKYFEIIKESWNILCLSVVVYNFIIILNFIVYSNIIKLNPRLSSVSLLIF